MNIIVTGNREPSILSDVLRKMNCIVEFISLEKLISHLTDCRSTGLSADAIVSVVHPDSIRNDEGQYTLVSSVARLVSELRALESSCAMMDGRKWAGIPFVVLVSSIFS